MSDLSDETRALFARGRAGVPLPAKHRSAIRTGLVAKLAALTVVGTTTTAAAAGVGTTWVAVALKVAGVATVLALVGGGTVALVRPQDPPPALRTAVPTGAPTSIATAKLPVTEPPAPVASAAFLVAPVPVAPVPVASVAITRETPRASTSVALHEPIAPAPPPARTAAVSSLETEARLLQDAHREVSAGQGAEAIRLLDEHERRFPASILEPERSAELVFALCERHERAAARVAADRFLAAHPSGPLAARVRGSCAKP